MIKEYQIRCYKEYKTSIGLPDKYNYLYGNPIKVHVPLETAVEGVMVIGAYPSAKFYTVDGIPDVPLDDHNSPFSSEMYFDGSRVRTILSGKELEENYLTPLGISRDMCWITDLVKVFLFKEGHINRYQKLGSNSVQENRSRFREYAQKSIPWINEELRIANPKVVFMLGAEVISVLLNVSESKAKDYMTGEVYDWKTGDEIYKAICFPHPGIIMKNTPRNPWPERFAKDIRPRAMSNVLRLKA